MNVHEAIATRRSVRRYRPDSIPDEVLDRLLNALRLAPSGSNRQPWRFVLVRDRAILKSFAEACTFVRPNGELRPQAWIADAPLVVAACGSERLAAVRYLRDGVLTVTDGADPDLLHKGGQVDPESIVEIDLAIALDHLSLAAMEEGLGTCWIGGMNERLAKLALGVPDDWRLPIAMVVGYPVEWPEGRARKPLAEIIRYDRFS